MTESMKRNTELQKAMALEIAAAYCRENGLSVEKLKKQRFSMLYGEGYFLQPSDVKPDGLKNDLATKPYPTLVIKSGESGLTIEQTEFTKKYLA